MTGQKWELSTFGFEASPTSPILRFFFPHWNLKNAYLSDNLSDYFIKEAAFFKTSTSTKMQLVA